MNEGSFFQFLLEKAPDLAGRTAEHVFLTGLSTLVAVAIGVPLGIWIRRQARLRGPVLGLVGVLQTIPSLALLAFLLPIVGIGVKPALVALILYALLPIVRNTTTGLLEVRAEYLEAADGLGFTQAQRLWKVELPLALGVIVAGVRTATVIGVGIATLAAFIGGGGLGVFILQGLASLNTPLILLGAIPAAVLALVLDFGIGRLERWLSRRGRDGSRSRKARIAGAACFSLLLVACAFAGVNSDLFSRGERVVRIGTKNFSEQYILGELMAQVIEAYTDLEVNRQFNLGSVVICHRALVFDEIDLYAEYTGTGYQVILRESEPGDAEKIFARVRAEYRRRFELEWLEPFGFNNTYAMALREDFAEKRGLKRLSQLEAIAGELGAGFPSEFMTRPDGYPGLKATYGLAFKSVREMDPGLMYRAVREEEVDVISGFSTDGRIPAYGLRVLEDDRGLFPPYYAAPVVRGEFLEKHPEIKILSKILGGVLDDKTMQQLNYEVDEKKRQPAEVAREFLRERGLIP